ncbi:uncharacterized protein LOC120479093 [Pimephales promelas]|uniref:uncharacterized protein LOC120479093 n=1 Tax=Pimephales promelas TaxID=90988 RepID=UPI001955674D|nr:uncharacterized protein LOC120479093 [Pimephales promelas]KAG1927471.1 hypothetical protein F2P79_024228 [Pimephales promelas]KAG1927472.1 hypothetical protein F2P79_024228 [Pimephales promelas]
MEKNAEVLVYGSSIMKDVWEIRLREHRQKRQLEEERVRKSALERINQDWQMRMSSKIKTPKRLERKAKVPEESTLDAHKAKKTHLGRPQGFQSSRIQRQVDVTKTTKANKLALLRHLNESCPGLMVWSKSWKFSKPLPQPEENPCAFDWGQPWKFLNLQPITDGKPWFDLGFDTNNNMSSNDMFLWETLSKAFVSELNQQALAETGWEESWIFTQKPKESHEGTNKSDSNTFYNLWRDQNQESASDWHESWKTMKPVKGGDIMPEPGSIQPSTNEETQPELPWENSWMYLKKQLHMKSKTGNNLGWSESWRVAKTISQQGTKLIESQAVVPVELHPDICNTIMNVPREMKHTIQFGGRDAPPSDWEKSWTTIKNLSEYKEEINKAECGEVDVKVETPKPDHLKQQSEHVKFNVLALPRIQKRGEMLQFSEQTDWKDSWKMLKRQRREERALRNLRRPQFSSTSQTLTEWASSWRFTNLPLNQDSTLWQQGWSANAQPRPIRRVLENEDFPHNGPAGAPTWAESWRTTRRQHLLARHGQGASTQSVRQQTYARSVADWEQSWTSSTHQDRPSMTEWTDSWRSSSLENVQPEHTWFEKSMEIKGRKELRRASDAFVMTFKERLPAKEWNDSWRVKKRSDGPGLAHLIKKEVLDWDNSWMFTGTEFYQRQGECYLNLRVTSDVSGIAMLKSVQIESRSVWGRSWKMSNPQPPKNIASWPDAKPKSFSAQDVILSSKHKRIHYLPSALVKDLKLQIWGKSWRFMKMDLDSKHGKNSPASEDESVIMTKAAAKRKHIYSNIDQQKPQQKRWSDACKIAKTQPRPRRNVGSGNKEDEDGKGKFAEWMESWKFSNNFKSHEPAMVSISLSAWENSWKFLLDPYAPKNGPKTSKSR